MGRPRARIAEPEGGIASRVDENPDTFGGDIEGNRRMRIARIDSGIGVHARHLFFAALIEREHLQPQSIDGLMRAQRKSYGAPTRAYRTVNLWQRSLRYAGQPREAICERLDQTRRDRCHRLGLADCRAPYPWEDLVPACVPRL